MSLQCKSAVANFTANRSIVNWRFPSPCCNCNVHSLGKNLTFSVDCSYVKVKTCGLSLPKRISVMHAHAEEDLIEETSDRC